MTPQALQTRIANGEDTRHQFKRDVNVVPCVAGAMLTADAISALLRAGESETLDFKERFGADVIETAVAFANTHGGTILIGVRDNAHIAATPACRKREK